MFQHSSLNRRCIYATIGPQYGAAPKSQVVNNTFGFKSEPTALRASLSEKSYHV